MKSASLKFSAPMWQDWHGAAQPIPEEVRRVASAFAELQEARHIADYDNHEQWTLSEALTLLNSAATAFQDWEAIRTHPLAMLVQRQR